MTFELKCVINTPQFIASIENNSDYVRRTLFATLYALLIVPKEDKTMITTTASVIAFVIISYCCYLVHSTFSDLQHVLSVEEVDNEQ